MYVWSSKGASSNCTAAVLARVAAGGKSCLDDKPLFSKDDRAAKLGELSIDDVPVVMHATGGEDDEICHDVRGHEIQLSVVED